MPTRKAAAKPAARKAAPAKAERRTAKREVLKQEPTSNRVTINISITPEQKDFIKKLAAKNGLSIARYMVTMALGRTDDIKLVKVGKRVLAEQTGDKYTFGCSEEDCAAIKELGRASGKTISRYIVEMCLLGELLED